jgi:hypothetical protein
MVNIMVYVKFASELLTSIPTFDTITLSKHVNESESDAIRATDQYNNRKYTCNLNSYDSKCQYI